ncbi:hypothetical protein D3C86_1918210 [compost metagenome]
MDLLVVQGRQVDPAHVAVDANHGWQAGGEVQVRRALLGAEGKQLSNVHGDSPIPSKRVAGR